VTDADRELEKEIEEAVDRILVGAGINIARRSTLIAALFHQRQLGQREGEVKGMRRAAEKAEKLKHPIRGDKVAAAGRERFYQTHIREAWSQAGHELARQFRTDADALEAEYAE